MKKKRISREESAVKVQTIKWNQRCENDLCGTRRWYPGSIRCNVARKAKANERRYNFFNEN